MEYERILELMEKMEKSSLTVLEYVNGDEAIRFEKAGKVVSTETVATRGIAPQFTIVEAPVEITPNGKIVKSPIVGTYYSASSPDVPPFIEVGSNVKKGDILCIVEAMKMMNEIECEFEGTVMEILVTNGQVVEFGQPLFVIS